MISSDFKQTLTNVLKNDYDIDCHRISPLPDYGDSRESTLHCSHDGEKFTMTLLLNFNEGDYDGVAGSFKVILPEMYAHKIGSINKKINLDLIKDSVKEVRTELSAYLSSDSFTTFHYLVTDSFSFFHLNINLIKGLYIKNSKNFDIKKIESLIESDSYINLYNSIHSKQRFAYVKIIGNEIMITPETMFKYDPVFKFSSTLVEGGMSVFKANLIKSVMIHLHTRFGYEKRYSGNIDFCLPLSYDELKQQLLVYQMANI